MELFGIHERTEEEGQGEGEKVNGGEGQEEEKVWVDLVGIHRDSTSTDKNLIFQTCVAVITEVSQGNGYSPNQ